MDNDHAVRILRNEIKPLGDRLVNEALDHAIAVLDNSDAPQCAECLAFTTESLEDVEGRKMCSECVMVWAQEASYGG